MRIKRNITLIIFVGAVFFATLFTPPHARAQGSTTVSTGLDVSTWAADGGYGSRVSNSDEVITHGAAFGSGGTGGVSIGMTPTASTGSERTAIIYKEAATALQSGAVTEWQASMDFSMKDLASITGSNTRTSTLRLGFSTNTGISGTSTSLPGLLESGLMVRVTGAHSTSAQKQLSIAIINNSSVSNSLTKSGQTYFTNWLRVVLHVQRTQTGYRAKYFLYDLGTDGTGSPTPITDLSSDADPLIWSFSGTNSSLFTTTNPTYFGLVAGTTISSNGSSVVKTPTYFDNLSYTVTTGLPQSPTAQAATDFTTTRFKANWSAPTTGLPVQNYVIELVKATDAFAAGNFISATGETGQATGITLGSTASSHDFRNLTRNTLYKYRVRSTNAAGASDNSEITASTADTNSAPTLDTIGVLAPIYPNDTSPRSVPLSGISTGGDDDQNIVVTVTSDNPSVIASTSATYNNPETTGTAVYTPTGIAGTATVTVTVQDRTGTTVEGSVTRTFLVRVQDAPVAYNFDSQQDMDQYWTGTGTGMQSIWGASTGIGGSGAYTVNRPTGTAAGYYNAWRQQPLNLVEKSLIQTSIMVNLANFTGHSTSSGVYLGFTHNTDDAVDGVPSGTATTTSTFMQAGSNTPYRSVYVYLGLTNASSGTLSLQIGNKSGAGSGSSVGTANTVTGFVTDTTRRPQWLKVKLNLTPTGNANEYAATATAELMGNDGTAAPAPLLSTSGTLTNETIYTASKAYPAFNVYFHNNAAVTGAIKLDQHEASVAVSPPNAPIAKIATATTTTDFTANWTPALSGPGATSGFILEVIRDGVGTFEAGPFIQANGQNGATGVTKAPGDRLEVFTSLARGAAYSYRLRALNSTGESPNSEVIQVSTSVANIPPTLDDIPAQQTLHTDDLMPRTVNLTGISNGGDRGQNINVTAVVRAGGSGIIQIPGAVNYTPPAATASFVYQPNGAVAGSDIIDVTVDDGEGTVTKSVTVTAQSVPSLISFDAAADFTSGYGFGVYRSNLAFNASAGRGQSSTTPTATGGLSSTDIATDDKGYLSAWRLLPYNVSDKTQLRTSIMFKPSGWKRESDDEQFYLGFGHLASGTPNYTFLRADAIGIAAYMSCNWKDSEDDQLIFGLANRTGTSNPTVSPKVSDLVGYKAKKANWFRITLTLDAGTVAGTYVTRATLEDMGADGVSDPVLVSSAESTLTNTALRQSTRAYAGFTSYSDDKDSGAISIDDHQVEVFYGPPLAPVITAPTQVTTTNATVNWEPAASSPAAVAGYSLEVVPADGGNIETGPYVQLSGGTGTSEAPGEPITISNYLTPQASFANLTRGAGYLVRVRGRNVEGFGPYSDVVLVQASADNIPPTLDDIAPQPAYYAGETFSRTVELTNVTNGGDVGQSISVSAVSDNPAVANVAVQPTLTTGSTYSMQYSTTGVLGIANIVVTVNDGEDTFSKSFTVRCQQPPDVLHLDEYADTDELRFGGSNSVGTWTPSSGTGLPASGGYTVSKPVTSSSMVLSGWRTQPFNMVGKNYMRASMMLNAKDWNDSGDAYLGFAVNTATNSNGMPSGTSNFLNSSSYRYYAATLEYSQGNNRYRVAMQHRASSSSTSITTNDTSQQTHSNARENAKNNWVRLSVTLMATATENQFAATVELEDMGVDGTAANPPVIARATYTLTNTAMAEATAAYASYVVLTDGGTAGNTYVDNLEASVSSGPPDQPLALAATTITTNAFTANWSKATAGPGPTKGYIVEMIAPGGDFDAEPAEFVQPDGSIATTGYAITSPTTFNQRFNGLSRGGLYQYRVRSVNQSGDSLNSNTVTQQTSPTNIPPTLNPIAAQPGIYPGDTAGRTVALSGIGHGGDVGQVMKITAVSSNPAIVPDPAITYTPSEATGSLTYTPTGLAGVVTITVTADDQDVLDPRTMSRTFTVRVQDPPPVQLSLDTPELMDELAGAVSTNVASAWNATAGTGSPAGGGIAVTKSATGAVGYYNGWRSQYLDLTDKTFIGTSIYINPKSWNNTVNFHLGFANNSTAGANGAPSGTSLFLTASNSAYRGISTLLSYNHTAGTFGLALRNKSGTGSATSVTGTGSTASVSNVRSADGPATHWLRLRLILLPTETADTYTAKAVLEDMGVDGTSQPVALGTVSADLLNADIFNATRAYASYNLELGSSTTGVTYLDNFDASASKIVPNAPLALPASLVVKHAFTANWGEPADSAFEVYRLEISKSADNFTIGTLLSETGEPSDSEGIIIQDTISSLRITGLEPNTAYKYRLRAFNSTGWGPASEEVSVTTLLATDNLPPTLNNITGPTTPIGPNSGSYRIPLTGITTGGEHDQPLTITATSSNQLAIPDPLIVNYDVEAGTAYVLLEPDAAEDPAVTITVTVDDGQPVNNTITKTFVVNVRTPLGLANFDVANTQWNTEYASDVLRGTITWGSASGKGNTGGLSLYYNTTDNVHALSGWRVQPYNLTQKGYIETSILIKPTDWEEKQRRERFYLGFAHNAPGVSNANTLLYSGTASAVTAALTSWIEDNNTLYFSLGNKAADENVVISGETAIPNNSSSQNPGGDLNTQWLKITLKLTPSSTTANAYDAVATLHRLGTAGTDEPVPVKTSNGTAVAVSGVLTNAAVFNSSSAYAAFTTYKSEKENGYIYLDEHNVVIIGGTPAAPTSTEPTVIVSNAFTANWLAPVASGIDGYKLEVSTAADNFAPGTLISATGVTGQTQPILLAKNKLNQRIAGLLSNTEYIYRILAYNDDGDGAYSDTVHLTTLLPGGNAVPTLAQPTFPLSRISPNAGPFSVSLSGITDGGEGNQSLNITATTSDPSIVKAPTVVYTSPNSTGSLVILSGGSNGIATITVTVNDGGASNNTVSRTFPVTVANAPAIVDLNTNDDYLAEFSTAASISGRAAVWGATSGKDGSAGLSISYHEDDKNTRYVSGWRKEPYAVAGASKISTSILVKPTGWGKDDSHYSSFHLGIAHNNVGVTNANSLLVSGTAASVGASLSYNKDSDPYLFLALSNKAASTGASWNIGRAGVPSGSSMKNNWLRLSVDYLPSPTTLNAYDVTAKVENLGETGTSAPTLLQTVQSTLVNATLFNSANTYAGYTHYMHSEAEATGTTYLDDHRMEVEYAPPVTPTIADATQITATSLRANWTMPGTAYAKGFLVELSTNASFSTLLTETGLPGGVGYEGIYVEGSPSRYIRISGLSPNTTYYYRVRSQNLLYTSDPSGVATATTLVNGQNLPPTIDEITAGPAKVLNGSTDHQVQITGISSGGEDETLTLTVTSSNPLLIPTVTWTAASPVATSGNGTSSMVFKPAAGESGTATLTFTPASALTGQASLTVTVSDGTHTTQRVFSTFVVANKLYVSPGNGTVNGAYWRFLDNGTDQGSVWTSPGFNDSAWKLGKAALGYGLSTTATTVEYGPNASDKYVTTYFRHHFNVDSPINIKALSLRMRYDDAAVIYLNGTEVARTSNMPSGVVTYTTRPTSNGDNGVAWKSFNIDHNLLVIGDNVLAVSVHQTNATSSDIFLDAELTAQEVLLPVEDVIVTSLPATNVNSNGFRANWTIPDGDNPGGFELQVIEGTNFATAPLLDANGNPGASTGIILINLNDIETAIEDRFSYRMAQGLLDPDVTYSYRIRALNKLDAPWSEVITVKTLAYGQNALPTLDPIADVDFETADPRLKEFMLTGIGTGGDDFQLVSHVLFTVSNPTLITSAGLTEPWNPDFSGFGDVSARMRVQVAAGQYGSGTVTVTVRDDWGAQFQQTFTVNVIEPQSPTYANWADSVFPGVTDPEIIGPKADADKDGVPNLLEYAFNMDTSSEDAPLAQTAVDTSGTKMKVTYRRRSDASDLQYIVQYSDDMKNWDDNRGKTTGNELSVELSATPITSEPGMELVTVELTPLISSSPRQFARVLVIAQ